MSLVVRRSEDGDSAFLISASGMVGSPVCAIPSLISEKPVQSVLSVADPIDCRHSNVAKIQAIYRGKSVRRLHQKILPQQLLPKLKEALGPSRGDAEMERLADAMCNFAHLFIARAVEIGVNTATAYTQKIGFGFDEGWFKLKNKHRFEVILIRPVSIRNTYTTVAESHKFVVPLIFKDKVRQVQYKPIVVKRQNDLEANGGAKPQDVLEFDRKLIQRGLETQRQLLEMFKDDSKVHLASLPLRVSENSLILEQERYNCSLLDAVKTGRVPLSFTDSSQVHPLRMLDIFNVMHDVAITLKEVYEKKQWVHLDIKPANILIRPDKNGKLGGHLSGFEWMVPHGFDEGMASDFPHSDRCCRKGWITPFADTYGLVCCLQSALTLSLGNVSSEQEMVQKYSEKFVMQILDEVEQTLSKAALTKNVAVQKNYLSILKMDLKEYFKYPRKLSMLKDKMENITANIPACKFSEEQKKRLLKLPWECEALLSTFAIVQDVEKDNLAIHQYLTNSPDAKLKWEKGTSQEKQALVADFEKKFFSNERFINFLQMMRAMLEDKFKQNPPATKAIGPAVPPPGTFDEIIL